MKLSIIFLALYFTLLITVICCWVVAVIYVMAGIWIMVLAALGPALAGTVGILGLSSKLRSRLYKVWKS